MEILKAAVEAAIIKQQHLLKGPSTQALLRLNTLGFATFETDRGHATVSIDEQGIINEVVFYN